MAILKKTFDASALPIAFSRGNPIPLDKTSLWFKMEDLTAYAKTDATAYVGQILSLIDETNNTATAYIIINTAGDLKEVGSATIGDNNTITLNSDGVLALANWGAKYYKWVEAVGTEGQDGYVAAHHELQVVDEDHPWIVGLEPKVVAKADGGFELAWYQPSTTTVEGLNSAIGTIQTNINTINNALGDADTAGTIRGDIKANADAIAAALPLAGGTMTGDITLPDGGKAISDTAVNGLIASAGHLKRSVVDALPEAGATNADTIYMVKDATATGADQYKEYMLIEGELVQIGDTSVDLTPYMKKVEGATADHIAALTAAGEVVDGGKTIAELTAGVLADAKTAADAAYVAKEEGKSLVADEAITKLTGLANIKSVGAGLALDEEGALTNSIEAYELPIATFDTLGGVKTGNGVAIAFDGTINAKVDNNKANGLAVGTNGLYLNPASVIEAGAMSSADFVKLKNLTEGAQVNVVEGALLGGVAATIDADKNIVIPIATADALGLVKGSTEDNEISIQGNGEMEVNRLSVAKLFVAEGDEFIIDGGNA